MKFNMKIKLSIIISILLFGNLLSMGQVRIKMQKDGGVYKIPCVVNGLRLKFIFDTGASNVCISLSEANLMLENGYLDKKDIVGKGKSQIADGSIINNTRIILREIKINDLILKDVEAIVINELKAPLLLGQSAIEKLGKIQIEGDEMIVINANNNISLAEIDEMFAQALAYFKDDMFTAAADTYQKLYDIHELSKTGILKLANSYYRSENYIKAQQYYLEIKDQLVGDTKESIDHNKCSIYMNLGTCFMNLNELSQAELYLQKSKPYLNDDLIKSIFYSNQPEPCHVYANGLYL